MLLLELSMFPTDKGESVGGYVARALKIIEESGIDYHFTAMGTLLEGEWDEIFGVVKRCFEELQNECNRIYFTIKGDFRKGPKGRMRSKVESVEQRLGKGLKK